MKQWYAVQTHPGAEARAVGHLGRQGFETFYPRYRKQRRHARKVETVEAPLFPGYAFISLDLDAERWRVVRSTIGVRRLICSGEFPMIVPDAVVDEIRRRGDGNGLVELGPAHSFRPGAPVEIIAGPLAGVNAVFEEIDDSSRIILLLDLMGRNVRLVIAEDSVRPLS